MTSNNTSGHQQLANSKAVNAELYGLAVGLADSAARSDIECMCEARQIGWRRLIPEREEYADEVTRAIRYLELRESSGDPMPYRVVRDSDKVRFE